MTETRAEFHARRRLGVGASDVSAICGCSSWGSRWSVWLEKVGALAPIDENRLELRLGHASEATNAEMFQEETGLRIAGEQTVLRRPDTPWFATIDGLVIEDGTILEDDGSPAPADALGVWEAKFTTGQPWERPPRHYLLQAQWAMYCGDFERCWISTIHAGYGSLYRIYEVERDDALIATVAAEVEDFWTRYVLTGEPPPVDAHDATTEAIKRAWPERIIDAPLDLDDVKIKLEEDEEITVTSAVQIIEDLRELGDEQRRLRADTSKIKRDITRLQNGLRVALGGHSEGAIGGEVVVTDRIQHRVTKPSASDFPVMRLRKRSA